MNRHSKTTSLPYPYNFLKDVCIEGEINNPNLLADLEESLSSLTDKEQKMICLRYREGHTLEDSGKALGVSKEYARKLVNGTIWRIRHTYRYNKIVHGKMPGEYKGVRPLTIDDLDLPRRAYIPLLRIGVYELSKVNGKKSTDCLFLGNRIGLKTLATLNRQAEPYGVRVYIED